MRLRGLVLAGALAGSLAGVFVLAKPIENPKANASIRDLVYWGAGGPIRIRLHLQVNGRPVDEVWSEAVNTLFAFCDHNGDGVLEGAELAPFNEPRSRNQQVIQNEPSQPALRLSFDDRKAKVTRPQFEAAIRTAGFDSVSLTITQAQANSQRLSTALFHRLDRDGDGKLSHAELLDARAQMDFFDANEDELISVAELLGRVQRTATRTVAQRRAAAARTSDGSVDLVLLPGDVEAASKQILEARGDTKSKSLRREDFAGDAQTFAALDKNGDGRLDAAELAAWLKQPPDAEFRFSEGLVNSSPGEERSISRPKVNFRFDHSSLRESQNAAWKKTEDRIRQQLKGVLDKPVPPQQVRMNQIDLTAFTEFAGRKTAGKVEPAELDAAIKVLSQLACCRVALTVRDQGDGLFELLDRNGDGQLSPRELVDAAEVLKPFADPAGKVGPGDLPRRFIVEPAAGAIPAVLSFRVSAAAMQAQPKALDLPEWFTSMDRNGDGELSLREFLGPIELFHKLDKNGDGLISPDEARGAKLDK
jgi:Ca2+-binding EF-hand superfamily protein